MIIVKTDREIELMREAGRIIAIVLEGMTERIKPGASTLDLDLWAEETIRQHGAQPAFKGYAGGSGHSPFPATLCTSINEEVVHGIPSKEKVVREGDIIGIDVGANYRGYFSDGAWTYPVGTISPQAQHLVDICKLALEKGILQAFAGNWLGNISRAIDRCVRSDGFEIVRDLSGHGVGRQLHEDPQILNYDSGIKGDRLRRNMTLAIEPMITAGSYRVESLADHWTVVTSDRSLSAHFEHTIVVGEDGAEILTRL